MEGTGPLLKGASDLVSTGRDKTEVLNTAFALIFTSRVCQPFAPQGEENLLVVEKD